MDPGLWTSPMGPVHGPPHGPGPWTTHMDPVHGPPHGPGPWTTPLGLSFVAHVGNLGNMEESEKQKCCYFAILDVPLQIHSYLF